jgi:hypothetical protein
VAGDQWGALVRYVRLAEQGCEEAAANAAWILLNDRALQWPLALRLAVRMLKRCGAACGAPLFFVAPHARNAAAFRDLAAAGGGASVHSSKADMRLCTRSRVWQAGWQAGGATHA